MVLVDLEDILVAFLESMEVMEAILHFPLILQKAVGLVRMDMRMMLEILKMVVEEVVVENKVVLLLQVVLMEIMEHQMEVLNMVMVEVVLVVLVLVDRRVLVV